MKKLTRQEQIDEAWEVCKATRREALQAYYDRIDEINEQWDLLI